MCGGNSLYIDIGVGIFYVFIALSVIVPSFRKGRLFIEKYLNDSRVGEAFTILTSRDKIDLDKATLVVFLLLIYFLFSCIIAACLVVLWLPVILFLVAITVISKYS